MIYKYKENPDELPIRVSTDEIDLYFEAISEKVTRRGGEIVFEYAGKNGFNIYDLYASILIKVMTY